MWIFLDLILIAIIVFHIFVSSKRGFIRTAIELVGFALSVYLAFSIGGVVAQSVYDNTIEPGIVEGVSESVSETATVNVDMAVENTWNALPDYVVSLVENVGIDSADIKESISGAVSTNNQTEEIAKSVSQKIVKPIIVPLIKTITSVIIFVVLMFVVRLLAKIINKAFSLPIIGRINKTLGGILGLGKGLIISAVLAVIISTIVAFSKDGIFIFTSENIEKTYLFSFLSNLVR